MTTTTEQQNKSGLTLTNKWEARLSFEKFLSQYRNHFKISSWTKYVYGMSHDGFTFHKTGSNFFGNDEIDLVRQFCHDNNFSFGFCGRKTNDPSGLAGIECEINICQ